MIRPSTLSGFIGRIGTDARGVRILVLMPGNVVGSDSADDPAYVAVIDGKRSGLLPGSILHVSWLDEPLTFE